MYEIGIDPGKSGGIAWIGDGECTAVPMPATERDLWALLFGLGMKEEPFALLEHVHGGVFGGGSPCPVCKQRRQVGAVSQFNFGMNYGLLRMALTGADIPWEEVAPRKWQQEFGLVFPKARGLTTTQKKNFHKAHAQQLFPKIKITHAIADALLIAEFCRRIRK